MQTTLDHLIKGEQAYIIDFNVEELPLKLLEMGCLPGNKVKLIQKAPFGDPLYLNINDSHLAIRKETAKQIIVEKVK